MLVQCNLQKDGVIRVFKIDESRTSAAQHGLTR